MLVKRSARTVYGRTFSTDFSSSSRDVLRRLHQECKTSSGTMREPRSSDGYRLPYGLSTYCTLPTVLYEIIKRDVMTFIISFPISNNLNSDHNQLSTV